MKSNGLKEEHYFNEIASSWDTKMHSEVVFWSQEGLCFLDLKNETFSQHHCHNKLSTIFDSERFFK